MRSTVVPIHNDELSQPSMVERQKSFNDSIKQTIGNHSKAAADMIIQKPTEDKDIYHTIFFDVDDHSEDLMVQEFDPDDLPMVMSFHDDVRNLDAPCVAFTDTLLGADVTLPSADGHVQCKVKRRKVDPETNMLLGTYNSNPVLDTQVYEVELPDGTYSDYSANVLIENIMASVDDNGLTSLILDDIIDHRFNPECVDESEGWYETPQGAKKRRITTRGCDINVLWKDGTSSWIPLKDMKEANP